MHVWPGSAGDRTRIYLQILERETTLIPLVEGIDANSIARIAGDAVIIATNWNAPNYRVMRVELSSPSRDSWREIIPEGSACIQGIAAIGGKLAVSYLVKAVSRVYIFAPDGNQLSQLELPAPGTVMGEHSTELHGRWDSDESFFIFQSFDRSPAVNRYNLKTRESRVWPRQMTRMDPERFEIHQVWYSSRDGTRVPMFLFHRRGLKLDSARPTMLNGYGGLNASATPFFLAPAIIWAVGYSLLIGGRSASRGHESE